MFLRRAVLLKPAWLAVGRTRLRACTSGMPERRASG